MNDSRKYENTLIAILFFSWGTLFLDRTALHSLAPYFVPEFHLSHQQIAMLGSVLAVTWALSALFLESFASAVAPPFP
jgi:sugar phosphate permease